MDEHYIKNKEELIEYKHKYYLEHKEKQKQSAHNWKLQHPERKKFWSDRHNRKTMLEMTDGYIANVLRVPLADIPPEILILKRAILQFKREIKNAGNRQSIGTNQ